MDLLCLMLELPNQVCISMNKWLLHAADTPYSFNALTTCDVTIFWGHKHNRTSYICFGLANSCSTCKCQWKMCLLLNNDEPISIGEMAGEVGWPGGVSEKTLLYT